MTVFTQFKSNQGLSNSDLSQIFNRHPEDIRQWVETQAPTEVTKIVAICNDILERQKLHDMPDIDRQQFEHRAELLNKEIVSLKAEVERLNKLIDVAVDVFSPSLKGITRDSKRTDALRDRIKAGLAAIPAQDTYPSIEGKI